MLKFILNLFQRDVDSIIATFAKTIQQLEAHASKNGALSEKYTTLQQKAESEAQRADAVARKIKALVS